MKVGHMLSIAFVLSSCSTAHSPTLNYDELLNCEMAVLVVANFHPSMAEKDCASLRAKLSDMSKSFLAEATSLKRTNAEIATDQRRVLTALQQRVQSPAGEIEAEKIVEEAKNCRKAIAN